MPGANQAESSGIATVWDRSSVIVLVRSLIARLPVGRIFSIPRSMWLVPWRPRRFAIGVIFCDCNASDPPRRSPALLALVTLAVWKASLRRRRWWMTLYLLRNASVLCDAGGRRDGLEATLRFVNTTTLNAGKRADILLKMLLGNVICVPRLLKGTNDLQPPPGILKRLVVGLLI